MARTVFLISVKIRKETPITKFFYVEDGSTLIDVVEEFNSYVLEPYKFVDCIINDREEIVHDGSYKIRHRNKLEMTLRGLNGRLKLATFQVYKKEIEDSQTSLIIKSLTYGAK